MTASMARPLRLGLPKGRVFADTRRNCAALGITLRPGVLRYRTTVADRPLTVHLLKIQDIARLLAADLLDLGVTGDEWLMENDVPRHQRSIETGSYRARLCLLTACSDTRPLRELRSVATPYPLLARQVLADVAGQAAILPVTGSTEALVPDVADAALDVVESGASAGANELTVRAEFGAVTTHLVRSRSCPPEVAELVGATLATSGGRATMSLFPPAAAAGASMRAAAIPPDLRFAAARALAAPGTVVTVNDVLLHARPSTPAEVELPPYLRFTDRDAVVSASSPTGEDDLLALLDAALAGSATGPWATAVITLSVVDAAFRELDLWPGNIYFAGVGALGVALDLVAGLEPRPRDPGEAEQTLRALNGLELVYLFPVAPKFRNGAYDGEIQYRLNGWGRALARRLAAGEGGRARTETARRHLTAHLQAHRAQYAAALDGLDVTRQEYAGDPFSRTSALPLPVLV
jgi:ATP phosphoribosyltransferase